MSLAIKYESLDDAQMRLRGTVVLYNGAPYLIKAISNSPNKGEDGPFRVHADALPVKSDASLFHRRGEPMDEADIRKFISSKHFDIAPFPMGFVNNEKGAYYVSRLPNRQQKQGLCGDTCSATLMDGRKISWQSVLSDKNFIDTVHGRYPSFAAAHRLISQEAVPSIAFSREFALSRDAALECLVYLYHKNDKVGLIENGGITLGKKFKYLRESLIELGVVLK